LDFVPSDLDFVSSGLVFRSEKFGFRSREFGIVALDLEIQRCIIYEINAATAWLSATRPRSR
jgi:hypothetical protein